MIKRSCQILTNFFLKNLQNRRKDALERVIILTQDENYLMHGKGRNLSYPLLLSNLYLTTALRWL